MVYCIIILFIFIIEIFVKDYIERHREYAKEKQVCGGKISVTKQYNTGSCMNFLEKKQDVVRYLSTGMFFGTVLVFLFQLPKKGRNCFKLGFSFVIGGALSNLCDRIMKGHVVDYLIINVKKLKNVVFNLADVFIFVGGILIMIGSIFHKKK